MGIRLITCCVCLFIFTITPFFKWFKVEAAECPQIMVVESFDVPVVLAHTTFFVNEMEKKGYRKENIRILKANGNSKKLEQLLKKDIGRCRPEIIVSNATLASKVVHSFSSTLNIPMVFFVVSDPVGAGLVSDINTPTHKNISGVVHSVPRETKLEMVMRVLKPLHKPGHPIRMGFIHSSYPSARGDLRMLKEGAQKRGDVTFISYEIPFDENNFNINHTLDRLKQGISKLEPLIDYWWIPQDPVGELPEFAKTLSKKSRHPIVCGTNQESLKNGALMYIAADSETGAKETALMVDMILKGKDAGTIPVHSPAKIDYGINLSTALKQGIAIPSDLLKLAGGNIQK